MNLILGFGSTEDKVEQAVAERVKNGEDPESVRIEYKDKAEAFDKMDRAIAPERYSYFFIVRKTEAMVKIKFHHINRRHPFSPDGWALMMTEIVLEIPRKVRR